MNGLLLDFAALALAPLVDALARGRPWAQAMIDGFSQVAVAGLLLAHVLPAGVSAAGWPAVFALSVGIAAGVGAHRLPGGEGAAEIMAVVALLLHCLVDGAALAAPAGTHGVGALGWAVVLHTLPVGLATWRIARERGGTSAATLLLLGSALATFTGWEATATLLAGASPRLLAVAQCVAAGALLHVLTHLGERGPRAPFAWGGVAGVALVVALVSAD
jgi:hypothetical protein